MLVIFNKSKKFKNQFIFKVVFVVPVGIVEISFC